MTVATGTQALLAVLSLALSAVAGSPAEAVAAAAADAAKLPKEIAHHCRYLSLYAIPAKDRAEFLKVLAFHVNSLSRETELIPPALVTPDLVRVNLLDYGWKRDAWEKLTGLDVYFHVRLEGVKEAKTAKEPQYHHAVTNRRRVDLHDGKGFRDQVSRDNGLTWEAVGAEQKAEKKEDAKPTTAHAPWLPTKEVAALAILLNSDVPIARADWFLYQTATQHEKGPGYYDFLGLGKKEEDFQELVGADVKLAKKVKKEIAAVVARSGVTLNNRSMERFQTINGPYWRTHDFKSNTQRQNTVRLLDGDTEPPRGDASEQYGTLPNGLFAFWLQNDKGERQDAAPDFIASDGFSSSTDRRVRIGISCVRCHEEGIKPIADWMRAVYRQPIQLVSVDYDKTKRLQRLYLSDLEGHVTADRAGYERALKALNGFTAKQNAQAYAKAYARFLDTDLTLEDVAREVAIDVKTLTEALKGYASGKTADPLLVGLLATPPMPMRREHLEEVYALLQEIVAPFRLRGVRP